jgi:manganese/iron transport system substrate-binding protein
MDPAAAQQYVAVIRDALSEADPEHADAYAANAETAIEEIAEARRKAEDLMACIPDEQRVLITSEAAFHYFSDVFGFDHDGIWGTNAEAEGTPAQMMRIVDLINERQPRAIFWESTISDRYVRSVSEDTGVPTAGPLYVDSVGESGSGAESYTGMLLANARLLRETLGQSCEDR